MVGAQGCLSHIWTINYCYEFYFVLFCPICFFVCLFFLNIALIINLVYLEFLIRKFFFKILFHLTTSGDSVPRPRKFLSLISTWKCYKKYVNTSVFCIINIMSLIFLCQVWCFYGGLVQLLINVCVCGRKRINKIDCVCQVIIQCFNC